MKITRGEMKALIKECLVEESTRVGPITLSEAMKINNSEQRIQGDPIVDAVAASSEYEFVDQGDTHSLGNMWEYDERIQVSSWGPLSDSMDDELEGTISSSVFATISSGSENDEAVADMYQDIPLEGGQLRYLIDEVAHFEDTTNTDFSEYNEVITNMIKTNIRLQVRDADTKSAEDLVGSTEDKAKQVLSYITL
jgi:hypothetical protein